MFRYLKYAALAVVLIAIGTVVMTCARDLDRQRDEQKAARDAYEANVRKTCVPLERNRPEKSRRYDTFKCGDVVEWIDVTGY